MADITDPQVINFVNEHLRPRMEQLRDMALRLTDDAQEYTTNITGLLAGNADGDVLVDGRAAQGVSVLTKLDISNTLQHLNAIKSELETVGAADLRAKVSVRPPRVN